MRIYHNQLPRTLNQAFKPVWLVFGDEVWQKNDALAQIKSHAQQQGFNEIIRFSVDERFDWQSLLQEYQAMSLFSSLRIIEVELTSNKIGDQGAKAISSLITHLHSDVQLIFHGAKLDAATQKRKWFKGLADNGYFLTVYELEGKQLQQWLKQQAQQLQLQLTADAEKLLLELFAGNVPALAQELQKLSLLFAQQTITFADAEQLLIKQAKFTPFQLIDCLLLGDIAKCLKILAQLEDDGNQVSQLIWFLHKEFNQIYDMLTLLQQGQSLADIYQQYRIWDKKKPLYQKALTNINIAHCQLAIARLAQVDLVSKSSSDFNSFVLLSDVIMSLYHGELNQNFSLEYESH